MRTVTVEHRPQHVKWHKADAPYRLLVESVKAYGILTLDPRGFITSSNEAAPRIKGYEAHEISGAHFSRFYPSRPAPHVG